MKNYFSALLFYHSCEFVLVSRGFYIGLNIANFFSRIDFMSLGLLVFLVLLKVMLAICIDFLAELAAFSTLLDDFKAYKISSFTVFF